MLALARRVVDRRGTAFILVTVLLCSLTIGVGYANKVRCIGPSFDSLGRSAPDLNIRVARDVCYSDIQYLWVGRDVDNHVFPYVSGGYEPVSKTLFGGSLEYPVLTGLAIWVAAAPSSNDGDFLFHSAILLGLAGLLTAALLAWLAGLRSWWYALAPPLVLYAFHNWDLLAVAATVVAFWLLLRGARPRGPATAGLGARTTARVGGSVPRGARTTARVGGSVPRVDGSALSPQRSVIDRPGPLIGAAIALGIGAGFKLYPLMFALPVALWLGAGGWRPRPGSSRSALRRWLVGAGFAAGAAAVFAAVNLPFAVAGPAGWWASFQFQWSRPIDVTTNTIWFWGARPYSDSDNEAVQHTLAMVATGTTLAALLLACIFGWLRYDRRRGYPWLQVCAAMVCGYLLFNKVHSPQFTLWLLPFFALLRIRPGWIISYFVVDAAIGIGFFRWQYLIGSGAPNSAYDALSPQLVLIGVWGRAALLIALFIVFLRSEVVTQPARRDRSAAARTIPGAAAPPLSERSERPPLDSGTRRDVEPDLQQAEPGHATSTAPATSAAQPAQDSATLRR